MRTINCNPLGIRKLDVQQRRRVANREHRDAAAVHFDNWFAHGWRREPLPLDRENVIRFAEAMLHYGYERGIHEGALATRERVAEALQRGTLVKP